MGYMHINNLYKDDRIFQFSECYALEKIHGTSAHIKYVHQSGRVEISFFSGGENYQNFIKLFDESVLLEKLAFLNQYETCECIIYGEAYGGKQQGMRETYGNELKFIAFDVKFQGNWLEVPAAENFVKHLGIEFVDYTRIPTQLSRIDEERNKFSTQAKRNGIIEPKIREGIVLRPVQEAFDQRGNRIISKHKNDIFSEIKTHREVDPDKLKVLADANKIADEWVTEMRLLHVLGKMPLPQGIENTRNVIEAMIEDVRREAAGEIVESKDAMKAISSATARLFKKYLNDKLTEAHNV